ncbi:MAG: hypothetical protein V4657_09370 [Pseudomonadota bacterium]
MSAQSIVERLRALHVWPQFVADTHADVILPRQAQGLYDVGNVATEAADTIDELLEALIAAEVHFAKFARTKFQHEAVAKIRAAITSAQSAEQ